MKFLTLLLFLTGAFCDKCEELPCKVCCETNESTGEGWCNSDALKCTIKPHSDFGILLTTLLIIIGFIIGTQPVVSLTCLLAWVFSQVSIDLNCGFDSRMSVQPL